MRFFSESGLHADKNTADDDGEQAQGGLHGSAAERPDHHPVEVQIERNSFEGEGHFAVTPPAGSLNQDIERDAET